MTVIACALAMSVNIAYMENGFAAEWFAVRSGSAPAGYPKSAASAEPALRLALSALDGVAAASRDSSEFKVTIASFSTRPGFKDAVDLASRLADGIAQVPIAERKEFWEKASSEAKKNQAAIKSQLERYPDLLTKVATDVGVEADRIEVLLLLVPSMPAPGAATYATMEGELCVVALDAFKPNERLEAVVHEVTHALDHWSRDQQTIFARLRMALAAAGIQPNDPRMRDVPHALVFAISANRVSEAVGDGFVPYGKQHGAYEKLGNTMQVVQQAWQSDLTLEEKVAEIVRRLTNP